MSPPLLQPSSPTASHPAALSSDAPSRAPFSPGASTPSVGSDSALFDPSVDSTTSVLTSQGFGGQSLGTVRSASPAESSRSAGGKANPTPLRPLHGASTPDSVLPPEKCLGAIWDKRKSKSTNDVTAGTALPFVSNRSGSLSHAATPTVTAAMNGLVATGGIHGAGVRRVSYQTRPEGHGTSPAPSNRLSNMSTSGYQGSLPLGRSQNLPIGSKPTAPAIERLQQRQRSMSSSSHDTRRSSSSSTNEPAQAVFDSAFEPPVTTTLVQLRNIATDSQFPQTPHEFSPILTPSNHITSQAPMPTTTESMVSVPTQRGMPKPPVIDPAPVRRRERPPLPIGPRKPTPGRTTAPTQPSNLHASISSTSALPVAVPLPPPLPTGGPSTGNQSNVKTMFIPESPKFQTHPVRWRGLTMDAAKWTLTSGQLQDIVGRAIRQSAEASSIRLLTLDTLDREIPEEIQRLTGLIDEIKSKYHTTVKRRRALIRSLSIYADGNDSQAKGRLMQELVDVCGICDQLSSALAMALRKLNSSFVKQSGEMIELNKHMAQVEAERDEAWATAERVETDLIELQAKMDALNGGSTPSSTVPSNRSSRVSAARMTSIRASKASLRISRGGRSSHSSMSSTRYSGLLQAPPVPPIPRLSYSSMESRVLSLNTDISPVRIGSTYSVALSSGSPHTISPTPEARALAEAQNDLYHMLGISHAELRNRGKHRPASELVSPNSIPASPLLSPNPMMTRSASESPSGRRRNTSFSVQSRSTTSMYSNRFVEI
ncbi:hypothetical protein K439DRAFT_56342 [Ramaria rubella]|nr:hypothetical protein K439DRAFT_56342 [Ramaria rubella]